MFAGIAATESVASLRGTKGPLCLSPCLILQFDARAQEAFCPPGKHASAIRQCVSIRGQKFLLPFNELARAAIGVHCLSFNRPFHSRAFRASSRCCITSTGRVLFPPRLPLFFPPDEGHRYRENSPLSLEKHRPNPRFLRRPGIGSSSGTRRSCIVRCFRFY